MPRAIRIHAPGGPEAMQWEEVAVGDPGPGEARIRHTAVGVNYIDTYHRSGLYKVPLPGDSNKDCQTEFTVGQVRSGRGDIFDIFLTGIVLTDTFVIQTANGPLPLPAGFNVNRPANVVPADMLRINTDIKGELCSPKPSRLGILGGDACGFPNGRRLTDDIVEIELLAVAGAAYQVLDARDSSFVFNPALIELPHTISASVTNGGIDTSGLELETLESSRRRLEARLNGGGPQVRIEGTNGGIRIGAR